MVNAFMDIFHLYPSSCPTWDVSCEPKLRNFQLIEILCLHLCRCSLVMTEYEYCQYLQIVKMFLQTLNSQPATEFVYSKGNLQNTMVMDHTKINLNNFLQPPAAYKYRISGCCLDCLEGFIAFILSFNVPITKLILMNWNDNFMQENYSTNYQFHG